MLKRLVEMWARMRLRQASLLNRTAFAGDAVWKESIRIGGVERPGFEGRGFSCRIHVPERAVITCFMATHDDEERFRIEARSADSVHSVSTDGRTRDRWTRVVLPLFQLSGRETLVAFSSGAGRVVWGEPSIALSVPVGSLLLDLWSACRILGLKAFLDVAIRRLLGADSDVRSYWATPRVPVKGPDHGPQLSFIVRSSGAPLAGTVKSFTAQTYANWQLRVMGGAGSEIGWNNDPRVTFQPGDLSAALRTAAGSFVAFVDAGDVLLPHALSRIAQWLQERPQTDVLYTDEEGVIKPDWSPDYFLAEPYFGRLALYRRDLLADVTEIESEHDVAFLAVERARSIGHLPEALCRRAQAERQFDPSPRSALERHLARTRRAATVENGLRTGTFRVRHALSGKPLVSIVIPTACGVVKTLSGPVNLLANCVRSIHERTAYGRYELIVCDNGSLNAEVEAVLAKVPHRRRTYDSRGPFNLAHKLNNAVRHAQGEYLVLLNDDTEVLTDDWLTAMLEYAQQPDVGIVAPKLVYPDGRLQHVGQVLNPLNLCNHLYRGHAGACGGYRGSVHVIRNFSSVTGACIMMRRSTLETLGGFDETLPHMFDVDMCLKALQRGLRVVYTPYSRLIHHESVTLNNVNSKLVQDHRRMRRRWGDVLRRRDPYWIPNAIEHGSQCS